MKRILFLFIFLILISSVLSQDIVITEIMSKLPGSDEGHEWIEIYNNDISDINVNGWKLCEGNTNHGLTLINGSFILGPGDFAVIVDNFNIFLIDYPSYSGNLYDSSWDTLHDNGELLAINDSSKKTIDEIIYDTTLITEGHSLELINPDKDNSQMGNWQQGPFEGTPGYGSYNNGTGDEIPEFSGIGALILSAGLLFVILIRRK
ncbi:lamin tail domain-containing protein [Candidatus Woesearchaeota archaeon]|nr:lamin tail domain-containing protein [Candidatus Woesearchaeota archaeon]